MAKRFKCPKCDRSFGMAMHLARHMTAMHSAKSKKKAKKAKKRTKARRKAPRRAARRGGRPTAMASKLRGLSLHELIQLVGAARAAARSKLAELRRTL